MLTLKQIKKVGRLLDQTGEPRPGFLHDEKANLEGPAGPGSEIPHTPSAPLVVAGSTLVVEIVEDENADDLKLHVVE